MDMVPVGAAALGVPSSTAPFSGFLGSAIVQRDRLVLPEQQGLLQGFYTAHAPAQAITELACPKVKGAWHIPAGSSSRLVPMFWAHPDRTGSGSCRQSLDVTQFMSGTGAAYPCSEGSECDTTGSGVGGDMLALCPLLWHSD